MNERFLRATNHFKQQHKCNNETIKANVFSRLNLVFQNAQGAQSTSSDSWIEHRERVGY